MGKSTPQDPREAFPGRKHKGQSPRWGPVQVTAYKPVSQSRDGGRSREQSKLDLVRDTWGLLQHCGGAKGCLNCVLGWEKGRELALFYML